MFRNHKHSSNHKNLVIHFVGIGGIGMSGIAEILLTLGYQISGSDASGSANTDRLKELGAKIYIGHAEENVGEANVVVYSSAISFQNPEMRFARQQNLPLIRRAEMLSEIMRLKFGIAVAGTHGKTTTTGLTATILHGCNLDPTHIIGGVVGNLKGNAKVGTSDYLVAEADESDGSFLLLNPIMSIITNIDNDHLDHYKNEENMYRAFRDFANKTPFYGLLAINIHDPKLQRLKDEIHRPLVTFGIREGDQEQVADFEAVHTVLSKGLIRYDLYYKGEFQTKIEVHLSGRHNVLNSLGAISIAYQLGPTFADIAKAITQFKGVGRRFETLLVSEQLEVIDDYAHHPTEILTTVTTARLTREKHLVVVFEPHRYTRTQQCWQQFLTCFDTVDEIYIAPIYAASEAPIEGVTSEKLVEELQLCYPGKVQYLPHLDELEFLIQKPRAHKSTLLFLGAGSIGKKVRAAVERIKAKL